MKTPGLFYIPLGRRRFLQSMAAATAGFTVKGAFAEVLTLTPPMTEGPYYPNNIPLDKDNDLLYLNDSITPALGTVTYVSGQILDRNGSPVRGALVETWGADNYGSYIHTQGSTGTRDSNYQGFGQYLTGSGGGYRFRMIKPGLYTGRTRHMHFGITIPGQATRWTTQLFWNEIPRMASGTQWSTTNTNDSVLSGVTDATQRACVIKDFTPVAGSAIGEMETTWDIVMGLTPVEPVYPGNLLLQGTPVASRYKITVPTFAGYSYEVYGNPTLGALSWAALPFSLSETGSIDRNIYTAAADGSVDLFLGRKAVNGFYYVAFRVPGANTGTPTSGGGGGPTRP